MMVPDVSEPVAAVVNRKGAKSSRVKATAVMASVNRSNNDKEDLFFESDNENSCDIEGIAPGRPDRPSTEAFTDDDPLPNRPTEAPTRSKGKGKHKILVAGTPEPGDAEKRTLLLSSEERCYQELLNARNEVRSTSRT